MAKKGAVIGVLASLGVLAGTVMLASKVEAAPGEPETPGIIPTADDILASATIGELEIWYIYIGQLYFTGQINRDAYESLYQAYVDRFYQLIGGNQ